MTVTSASRAVEARIALLAARQCSSFARAQALDLGATDPMVQRRVRTGVWRRPFSGVYAIAGSERSWLQDVWCAFLAAGPAAVVTHESALHLHGIHLVSRRPISLTVRHGGRARLDGVFVHQIDDLKPHRVATVSGLPVSTVERTVVELAATIGEKQLGKVIDDVVAAKRSSVGRISSAFREVVRPGKPGVHKLARLLDGRGDGFVPAQSDLEQALFASLAAGGLPAPRRQFRLPGRCAVDGLVDAAYPDVRLIVEVDGRRWHTSVADLKRDHERDTEAARAGWLTLRFVYEHVMQDPSEVCSAIADVRRSRGALSSPEAMTNAGHGSRQ